MCGINGIITKSTLNDIEKRIKKMNASIAHRGPDADSYIVLDQGQGALGHRRLSVIDLNPRSNQPFISASGRWILVYNGEIYNYKELKPDLSYPFRTDCDTEVVAAYIETKGIEAFLAKCNGMFAFAAYDTLERRVYLCRDRLGIKPLYYSLCHDTLIFSSEIKGILHSGLVEAVPDKAAMDDYFGYRYIREPYTLFKNIKQVESGCCLSVSSTFETEEMRYWDIPTTFNFSENYDEDEIIHDFGTHLEDAVNKRMIADVPLGTYLSGGVDSSLLSAMAAQKKPKLNTYTIGFPELNEFAYAQMISDKYQTKHHELYIDRHIYQNKLEEIIRYKDAPLGVPNEIPLAIMSRELKKDITVVLSGEGADELLGGYGRIFRSPFDYQNYDRDCGISFYQYFINQYEYVPRRLRDAYLTSHENRRLEYDAKISEIFDENCNEYNVFRFFHKYHVKGLLQRVDTTTMLASVEARVPFLDHRLVEYAYREIPYDLKLKWKSRELQETARKSPAKIYSEKNDIPKYLLKKLSYHYLPAEVIERKKMGFPVPLDQWNRELTEMAFSYLSDSVWFCSEKLEDFLADCRKEKIGNQILWMFLNIEIFFRSYFTHEWRY